MKSVGLKSLVVVLLICSAHLASANESSDKEIAKRSFIEGRRLYDVGEYRSALASFKNAYLHYEDGSFLFNIAQCHRQLGDKSEALRAYKSYLNRNSDAPNRPEVQRLITLLQTAIADDARAKQAPPSPERIASPLDHREPVAGSEPATTATAGATSSSPGAPPASTEPAVVTTSVVAATAPADSDRRKPAYKKWWVWTTIAGVAVVGAAVGIGVYYGTRPHFGATLPGFSSSSSSALTLVRF